jgi:hypothetical protein
LRRRRRKGDVLKIIWYSVTVFYRVYKEERKGYGQMAGCCECGTEPSGSIKCG